MEFSFIYLFYWVFCENMRSREMVNGENNCTFGRLNATCEISGGAVSLSIEGQFSNKHIFMLIAQNVSYMLQTRFILAAIH
jgi:hypothetical protein